MKYKREAISTLTPIYMHYFHINSIRHEIIIIIIIIIILLYSVHAAQKV